MPLDTLLAFTEPKTALTALDTLEKNADVMASALLLRPSSEEYSRLRTAKLASRASSTESGFLRASFPDIPTLLSASPSEDDSNDPILSTTTESLTLWPMEQESTDSDEVMIPTFNATAFMRDTAFVRIYDEALPGPEYDIPYHVRAAARPKNEEARRVWERVYENFRARRQDTCGLDLEAWQDKQELK